MAITQAMCTSFKIEILNGVHVFSNAGGLSPDTFKLALYTSATTLDASTLAYGTPTNEVSNVGTGYTTGGATLTVASGTPTSSGTTSFVSFNTPVTFPSATFTARGALIYNSTKSNKAVAVLDFGSDKSVSGATFTVQMPTADSINAIIRITAP